MDNFGEVDAPWELQRIQQNPFPLNCLAMSFRYNNSDMNVWMPRDPPPFHELPGPAPLPPPPVGRRPINIDATANTLNGIIRAANAPNDFDEITEVTSFLSQSLTNLDYLAKVTYFLC